MDITTGIKRAISPITGLSFQVQVLQKHLYKVMSAYYVANVQSPIIQGVYDQSLTVLLFTANFCNLVLSTLPELHLNLEIPGLKGHSP